MSMPKLTDRRYVTAEELATILDVTKNAIYKMAERKEIPGAVKIGRRLRFREDLLEQWLDSCQLTHVGPTQ